MGGGSTQTQNNTNWGTSTKYGFENTEPWSVQTPYLKSAFSRAEDAYNRTMGKGPYAGDFVAQGNWMNDAAFNQAFNFGTDKTNNQYVQNQMDASNDWIKRASELMGWGDAGLRELSGDQTDNIIGAAGKYADNPYINAALQAAMADAQRQASESTVPNLYRAGAANNTLMSDRAALSQGVVDRGLAELAGNLSGKMRYDAYGKGIDTARGELDSRRNMYGGMARLGQDRAALGMQGLSTGIDNQNKLNRMSIGGAEGMRTMRQLGLDNAVQKYQQDINFPWQALANYYNIIGNKSWGSQRNYAETTNSMGGGQSTTETRQNPGAGSIAGSVVGGADSLLSGGIGTSLIGGLSQWFR